MKTLEQLQRENAILKQALRDIYNLPQDDDLLSDEGYRYPAMIGKAQAICTLALDEVENV